jgi:hypothetical protein
LSVFFAMKLSLLARILCVGGNPGTHVFCTKPGGQPLKRILADRPVLRQQCGGQAPPNSHPCCSKTRHCLRLFDAPATADSRQPSASTTNIWQSVAIRKNR